MNNEKNYIINTLGIAWVGALPGPNGCLIVSKDYKVDKNPLTDHFYKIQDIISGDVITNAFVAAMYQTGNIYRTIHPFKILVTVSRDMIRDHNE